MDVVALKTPKLRGQAWVAFLEVTSASNAVRQMQNFPFYDKPMVSQAHLVVYCVYGGHVCVYGVSVLDMFVFLGIGITYIERGSRMD